MFLSKETSLIVGIASAFLIPGIVLLVTFTESRAIVAGWGLIGVSAVIYLALFMFLWSSHLQKAITQGANSAIAGLSGEAAKIQTQLADARESLEKTILRIPPDNDARFLTGGFIGLQRQAVMLDSDPKIGPDHARMAVLGHLPSFMRLNDLSETTGYELFRTWQPQHYVPEYVRLTNRRKEVFAVFLQSGGIIREIYNKSSLESYVKKGSTFHDDVKDPNQEIKTRLEALMHFLGFPNYYLHLLEGEAEHTGPNFVLKSGVGLLVDLRTKETSMHFTDSIDALYTTSPEVLAEFENKYNRLATAEFGDKDVHRKFINTIMADL